MTRWAIIFEDTPAMLSVRKVKEPQHLEYLAAHPDTILIAGALRSVPEAPPVGGLWIVEADSYEDVLALVEADPYFVPEHRNFKILAWGKAQTGPITL